MSATTTEFDHFFMKNQLKNYIQSPMLDSCEASPFVIKNHLKNTLQTELTWKWDASALRINE